MRKHKLYLLDCDTSDENGLKLNAYFGSKSSNYKNYDVSQDKDRKLVDLEQCHDTLFQTALLYFTLV